jgi:hypothetical protein
VAPGQSAFPNIPVFFFKRCIVTRHSPSFVRLILLVLPLFLCNPAHAAFTDNSDGTVTDSVTGLMWDKCSWGQSANDCSGGAASAHTWLAALGVAVTANGSTHKGYTDWRLPSRTELESLVKIDAASPAIDTTVFPNTPSSWFWSSTTYAPDPAVAWLVDFGNGNAYASSKANNYHVRLVRSGQFFAPFDSQSADTTPDAYTFTAQTNAARSTVTTSNTITVVGIDSAAAISISSGDYSISTDGGTNWSDWSTTTPATVSLNHQVKVRLTSSASYSTAATATLTIGGVDGAFTVTTEAAPADTTPDAYTFTAQANAARSTVTTSNAITVAGIDSAAAISISGGEYEINTSGTWVSGAGTVNNGNTVKVRLTSSASYSSAATATLTIGGVDGAFTVTTGAAPAPEPSYDPPPPPTTLTVSVNGSGTLTSSITQVTVNSGGTLTIPATIAAAGVTLNLPTPGSGAASPVTLTLNGQSLNVTPGGAGTVLRVTTATVTLNGVPTVVQLISLSAGSITVSGSGQTLLSIGGGATPRLLASGGNEAVTALATLDAASGETLLAVSGGMVVLPALNTATRSAAAQETEIHAGETVTFDSVGQIKSHRVGSTSGSNGAGDPLTIANRPATLTLDATLSNLKGGLARLDGQSPEQAALALLGADFTLGNGGQTAAGVLPLTVGQTTLHLLPLGPLDIDASQPDGVSLTADGLYQFARNGVVMRFAPSVRDSRQLADDLASTFSGAATTLHNDGVIVVRVSGVDFVMQPELLAESGSGNAMGFDFDGEGHLRYRDAQGYRQVLHPAFADLATLRDILTAAIPGIVVNRNNGVTTAAIGAITYTLVSDYTLTGAPAEQAGRSWWSGADGKLYIRNADGTAQGFAVR